MKKNIMLVIMLSIFITGICFLKNTVKVNASGNTSIQTIVSSESYHHKSDKNNEKYPTYDETRNTDTGIRIYSSLNDGLKVNSSDIKLDSNSFYIDFANAKSLYYPSKADSKTAKSYRVSIKDTSNKEVWYVNVKYSVDDGFWSDTYKRVIESTGQTAKTTKSDSDFRGSFNPNILGTYYTSLSDGKYTITISRSFDWKIDGFWSDKKYSSTSSLSVNLIIDTVNPSISIKGKNTGTIYNKGAYVNEPVIFTFSDSNFTSYYYKTPGSNYFLSSSSKNYTTGTTLGNYSVYAKDKVGNKTDEISVYFDNQKPSGYISSDGKEVVSGSYIDSSFMFNAVDSGAGIKNIYYSSPVNPTWQKYSQGSIVSTIDGDGWYKFYCEDKAGNISDTYSVFLETKAPLIEIIRNGNVVYSKVIESNNIDTDIYFNRGDLIKLNYSSSSNVFASDITFNDDLVLDDQYDKSNTFSVTSATGKTSKFYYYIIDEKPYIEINGKRYESNSELFYKDDVVVNFGLDSIISNHLNTGITIYSSDGVYSNYFIKHNEFKSLDLNTKINSSTTYYISVNDRAGNISTFTIHIDKDNPVGNWTSNTGMLDNDGSTNSYLSFNYDESDCTAQYSYEGFEFKKYEGQKFYDEGKYSIVLTDKAGNKSIYFAYIDKTEPIGKLYANHKVIASGSKTSGNVYLTWDGDDQAMCNGQTYVKNTLLVDEGLYEFILTDKAGNKSFYTIIIDNSYAIFNKNNIFNSKDYYVSSYYKVNDNGKTISFANYEEALKRAIELEIKNHVKIFELKNISDFNGNESMVAPGDKISTGKYFVYKSETNSTYSAYYFDEDHLSKIVEFYASKMITGEYYASNNVNQNHQELDDSMYENFVLENGIEYPLINNYCFEKKDSQFVFARLIDTGTWKELEFGVPFKDQFKSSGVYEIKEVNALGNETKYFVFLDLSTPNINVNVANFDGSKKEMIISGASINSYYYKSLKVNSINDNDKWTLLKVTFDGNETFYKTFSDVPEFNEKGEYLISCFDRLGNKISFTIYIGGLEPTINFSKNNNELNVNIQSNDNFNSILSVSIYKNGTLLNNINTADLSYLFNEFGEYKVVVVDVFGRTVKSSFKFYSISEIQGQLDSIKIDGLNANNKSQGSVIISNLPTGATYQVYLNNNPIEYLVGNKLTDDGSYKVVVTLEDGTESIYTFDIEKTENNTSSVIIVIVILGILTGAGIYIFKKRRHFSK